MKESDRKLAKNTSWSGRVPIFTFEQFRGFPATTLSWRRTCGVDMMKRGQLADYTVVGRSVWRHSHSDIIQRNGYHKWIHWGRFSMVWHHTKGANLSTSRSGLWLAGTNVQKPAKKFPQGLEMGKSVGVFIKAPII